MTTESNTTVPKGAAMIHSRTGCVLGELAEPGPVVTLLEHGDARIPRRCTQPGTVSIVDDDAVYLVGISDAGMLYGWFE